MIEVVGSVVAGNPVGICWSEASVRRGCWVVLFELHEVCRIAYRAVWYLLCPSFALEMLVAKHTGKQEGELERAALLRWMRFTCAIRYAATRRSKHSVSFWPKHLMSSRSAKRTASLQLYRA